MGGRMEDIDIYDFAQNVLSVITGDLNEGIYSELGGEISLSWSTEQTLNAWARSEGPIGHPPKHRICIHYELVRQIYRDIEGFCDYLDSGIDDKFYAVWFKDFEQPLDMLPCDFSPEAHRKNMFIAAITWVYFHELGHLKQEHGYIRNKFLNSDLDTIEECNIYGKEAIEGRDAAIYHTTEMAADFEAVDLSLSELIRHFKGEDLKPSAYLMVCGLSCALYRLHGNKSLLLESEPTGTHPNPLNRLENVIPQIYEFLSIPELTEHTGIELSRKTTVELCIKAASSVGLFWSRHLYEKPGDIPDEYFLMGNLERINGKSYLRTIMSTWDEIEPAIQSVRRFGSDFGMLRFTEETRKRLS